MRLLQRLRDAEVTEQQTRKQMEVQLPKKAVVQVQIPRLKSEQKVFQRVKSWVSYMHLPWKMPDIKWNTDTNGYRLIAAFDVAQSEVGKEISGIQIRHIDELESFCAEHHPKVAVLCVPRDGAEQVSGRLVDLGIEGFWNFSHYDLSVPYPDVVVENVHLGDSLMSLGYRLRNQD